MFALVLLSYNPQPAFALDWDCGILPDCGFDNLYGNAGLGSGPWKPFKSPGSAIQKNDSDAWPKGPSLWIQGDVPYDSGVYQQVKVTPGTGYTMRLAYAVVNVNGKGWQDQINRMVGIDPYGGTDPHSDTVKWSSDYYGRGKFEDDVLQTSEYAHSSTITVFVRVINPYNDRHVDVFIDSARLEVNTSMPPIAVTGATPTNPPTATKPPQPTAPPATVRPTVAPTEVAEAPTETAAPTDTAVPQPTATALSTIKPDNTPTRLPTRTRRATSTAIPEVAADEGTSTNVLALSVIGGLSLCGVLGAIVLFGVAFWYWRKSKQPRFE